MHPLLTPINSKGDLTMIRKKKCRGCGKEFEPSRNGKQLYCSRFCYPIKINSQPRTCAVCGTDFSGHHGKFCSLKCYSIDLERKKAEYRQKLKEIRAKNKKICAWCAELFIPSRTGNVSLCCCYDCSYQYRKQVERIRKLDLTFSQEQAELEKLKQLGKGYQLPEREVDA